MEKITKLDNMGRGITYIDNKITFIKNTLEDEEVDIKITKSKSKYNEGEVTKYYKKSPYRIESLCTYYDKCGGCSLLHTTYEHTIDYKKNKLKEILKKYANLDIEINFINNPKPLNYRNKISLKIHNNKIGYYEEKTHKIISIKSCLLAEESINDFIKDIKYLNIINGNLTIRNNYNNELLIIIDTKDKLNIDIEYLKNKHKIAGIVVNNKTYYNDTFLIENINNLLFKVSYDSFFQVNRIMCSKMFDLVKEEITNNDVVLDLYSGVGTLGINVAKLAKKVYGIEIVENAVINASYNTKINKVDNAYYMLGDVGTTLSKINDNIDIIIVDPPRAGLDNKTKQYIINSNSKKIIYVSCDPITLARDIKDLSTKYNVTKVTGLDLFSYTYHCESITVLERR